MRKRVLSIVSGLIILSCSSQSKNMEVKSLLLDLMKNSHTEQHWFVPTKIALEGLTAEQSNWKDSTDNHSIGELVSHLIFWNEMNLRAFKGEDMTDFEVDNETTFVIDSETEWRSVIYKLDSVQIEWESVILSATEGQLTEWSKEIANIQAHTAYHTGQMVYIRKRNGWWPKK